jgi:hypothetical protein
VLFDTVKISPPSFDPVLTFDLEKLDRLQEAAIAFRKQEEEFLVQNDAKSINREDLYFFYPAEESEEFE